MISDIDMFFPSRRSSRAINAARTVLRSATELSNVKRDSLFDSMASIRLSVINRELRNMQRGVLHLAGDHNQIVSRLSQSLSVLGRGDCYVTVSVPSFWYPGNLGVMGRFLTMNKLVARRGAIVGRVFVLTPSDLQHPHFRAMLDAQRAVYESLSKSNPINTKDGKGRYYCGFVVVTDEVREKMMDAGDHFGLWTKRDQRLLVFPYYTRRDNKIAGVRFWSCPADEANSRQARFDTLIGSAICRPITEQPDFDNPLRRVPQNRDARQPWPAGIQSNAICEIKSKSIRCRVLDWSDDGCRIGRSHSLMADDVTCGDDVKGLRLTRVASGTSRARAKAYLRRSNGVVRWVSSDGAEIGIRYDL